MKATFTYTVLQYVEDTATAEFVNKMLVKMEFVREGETPKFTRELVAETTKQPSP